MTLAVILATASAGANSDANRKLVVVLSWVLGPAADRPKPT